MEFKFDAKSIIGLLLIAVGTVLGIVVNVPIVDIVSLVTIVVGATMSIVKISEKIDVKGTKKYIVISTIMVGTVLLALGGYTETTITEIIGAIVVIASVIFGTTVKKEK